MSYRLTVRHDVESDLQRVAAEQIGRARQALEQESPVDAIHRLRQRCKKLRALLRLVRPTLGKRYAGENRRFRNLARSVASQRDEQVLIETFDALMRRYAEQIDRRHFSAIRRQLQARRRHSLAAAKKSEAGNEGAGEEGGDGQASALSETAALVAVLEQALSAVPNWTLSARGFDAVGEGLAESYRRGRRAWKRARRSPTTSELHEWRKQIKYHRYHCELLRDLWPAEMKTRSREAHRLSDWLGEDHDLATLRASLDDDVMAHLGMRQRAQLAALIEQRRQVLSTQAFALGRRLYAEPTKALHQRFARYWQGASGKS
ncbi:CHAD domain-containing protein [Salinicola avicenniae]|uniref:CHAD domain-containing protein n=1 Tax=Salinicola avicenniae TaxID=2916836 RepID=UPI0020733AC7|nr:MULTISPECIES: CHAD domain-containing protein [unclassified Salinicola]